MICGCKTHVNNPVSEKIPILAVPSSEIVGLNVSFVDTLSQNQAEEFVVSLNLTVSNFSQYNNSSPHIGLVKTPTGQEQKWIDSLLTYPIVVAVSPLIMVTN
jgi:hypothetical protein